MVHTIIARLKEGSIPDVVLYADAMEIPPLPYVVVKPEAGTIPGTRQYRITAHHQQGMFDALENYVLKELDLILGNGVEDDEGGRYKLYKGGFTDITAEPDHGACFMERIYYTPFRGA